MSMPTAPGKNFLKATGIFYTIAGGLSVISALILWVISLMPSTGYNPVYAVANNVLPTWRLTAVNRVFAVLNRVYPRFEPVDISAVVVRPPDQPMDKWYSIVVGYKISGGIALTCAAVIVGIFIVFIGITAVKYCATLNRAKLLVIFALINLVIMVISTILLVSIFSVLGCVIAVLFLAGAYKNYKEIYPKQVR